LDTDIASYILKRRSIVLESRFRSRQPGDCAISSVTYAEILYGLERTSPGHKMRRAAGLFLNAVDSLSWPVEAAARYAEIKHDLWLKQNRIGELDMMIAAHAVALDVILITNNTRHFSRIGPPLRMENWLE